MALVRSDGEREAARVRGDEPDLVRRVRAARDLLAAPRDPDYNPADNGSAAEGTTALVRALIKFERWDEILRPHSISWASGDFARSSRDFAEALALANTLRTLADRLQAQVSATAALMDVRRPCPISSRP